MPLQRRKGHVPTVEIRFGMTPDDPNKENVVYIRAKRTLGEKAAFERKTTRLIMSTGQAEAAADGADATIEVPYSATELLIANLTAMVIGWQGPMFSGEKYSPSLWGDFTEEDEWWMREVNRKIKEVLDPPTSPPPYAEPETDPND